MGMIKVTVEYDGVKSEREIPVGDLRAVKDDLAAYCGLSPEVELVAALTQHIEWTLAPHRALFPEKPLLLRMMVAEIVQQIVKEIDPTWVVPPMDDHGGYPPSETDQVDVPPTHPKTHKHARTGQEHEYQQCWTPYGYICSCEMTDDTEGCTT